MKAMGAEHATCTGPGLQKVQGVNPRHILPSLPGSEELNTFDRLTPLPEQSKPKKHK